MTHMITLMNTDMKAHGGCSFCSAAPELTPWVCGWHVSLLCLHLWKARYDSSHPFGRIYTGSQTNKASGAGCVSFAITAFTRQSFYQGFGTNSSTSRIELLEVEIRNRGGGRNEQGDGSGLEEWRKKRRAVSRHKIGKALRAMEMDRTEEREAVCKSWRLRGNAANRNRSTGSLIQK